MVEKHEPFMLLALREAQKALKHNEVPVGAIVVDRDGVVIARAYNSMEKKRCQTGHAEMVAIQRACKKLNNWRLLDCWLYVTLEPCVMCFGLIKLVRMSGVVYGAKSPLFGIGSYAQEAAARNLQIVGGLKESESADILKLFFKQARKMKRGSCETKTRVP